MVYPRTQIFPNSGNDKGGIGMATKKADPKKKADDKAPAKKAGGKKPAAKKK